MAHKDIGLNRLRQICEQLGDIAKVESAPKHVGRRVLVMLAPDRPKIESIKRKLEAEKKKLEQEKGAAPTEAPAQAPEPGPQPAAVEAEREEAAESVASER
jgi:hypothetical protein